MTDTVQLICEGPCNPNLADIDRELMKSENRKKDESPVGTQWLWSLQRTLIYTEHVMVQETVARCTVCYRTRRYGGGRPLPSETGGQS